MDIDLFPCKNILILSILLWLPQLLITDALQVENKNNTYSCDENDTAIDTARKEWPIAIEPFDLLSSLKEFTTLPPSSPSSPSPYNLPSELIRVTPKITTSKFKLHLSSSQSSQQRIEPTPILIRFLVSSESPSLPFTVQSSQQNKHQPSSHTVDSSSPPPSLLSSSMLAPSSSFLPSSNVQATPTNEIITGVTSNQLISSIYSPSPISSSSPIQSSPIVNNVLSRFSHKVNDSSTYSSLHASHTVHPNIPDYYHPNGHQPFGSQLIHRVMSTTIVTPTKILPDDLLTTTNINYDDETFVNNDTTTSTSNSANLLPSKAYPKESNVIINETSLSHNLSPATSSSFFPALSGTISFITKEDTTSTESPATTEFNFSWTPVDITYYSNNYTEIKNPNDGGISENHHEIPEAATSNTSKCDHRGNWFTQPSKESGFLVRSVLKRYDTDDEPSLSLDNLTAIFETRLAGIFNLAYRNQFKGLRVRPDRIKKDVHVKLWNLFWNNSTNDFHLIYQIEQDNHPLLARDLQTLLSHISPVEMSDILGYNGTIKVEPYVYTSERKSNNNLASALEDLDWIPFLMILLSVIVFIFCTLLTLIACRKNRRLRSSSPNSSSGALNSQSLGMANTRLKNSIGKPIGISKLNSKENLVNWRKVSGPGSKRSFLGGSHSGSGAGLNLSGSCSATSGTIDSNHEFEYLSFDSPTSSLKLRTAEYRPRRPYTGFSNHMGSHGSHGSSSRLELTKEKVIPIGELDEIAELSSSSSSHDTHHSYHHQHPASIPSSRMTYVTTKEEIIGDYENPLMSSGVDEVDCSVPQLIQVHISEQTQNIIQAIRSELKKFNPITGTTNVQSQSRSQLSIPSQHKESTSTSDA